MSKIINGKNLSKQINKWTIGMAQGYRANHHHDPTLATVWVGGDKASALYAKMKERKAKKLGINAVLYHFSDNISQNLLDSALENLSSNRRINAILLQLPLPKNLDANKAAQHITPDKDVDGVNPVNLGKLASGVPGAGHIYPAGCTPLGIMYIINHFHWSYESLDEKLDPDNQIKSPLSAVVIGRSNIVGRPLSMMLLNKGYQVTTLNHLASQAIDSRSDTIMHNAVQNANVVISATGIPDLVKGKDINPKMHTVLIDAGEDTDKDGHLCGDISKAAKAKSSAYTPVPGGVGPMTITMLMKQTVQLAYSPAND